MKSTLPQLLVPESAKDSVSMAVAGGYAMNNGTGLSASLPYPQGQPYRVPDLRVMIVMEGEGSLGHRHGADWHPGFQGTDKFLEAVLYIHFDCVRNRT